MALKSNQKINSETTRYATHSSLSPLMAGSTTTTIFAGAAVILAPTQPTGLGGTQGSGQAINGDALICMAYTGSPASGVGFLGVCRTEVKNWDLTKVPRTVLRPTEAVIGEPVLIGNDCEVWTDQITGVPTPGAAAYLATGSTFGISAVNGNPSIGKWLTFKDAAGFALLSIKVS